MYANVCWDKDNIVQNMESKTTSVMDEWHTDRDENDSPKPKGFIINYIKWVKWCNLSKTGLNEGDSKFPTFLPDSDDDGPLVLDTSQHI